VDLKFSVFGMGLVSALGWAAPLGPLGGSLTHSDHGRAAFEQILLSSESDPMRPSVERGQGLFRQLWQSRGPLFNAPSCMACHARNARGLPLLPENRSVGLLFRLIGSSAGGDPVLGTQLNPLALQGVPREAEPRARLRSKFHVYPTGERVELVWFDYDYLNLSYGPMHGSTVSSPRNTPNMIGLGLLDAVLDATLLSLEDPLDRDRDGVSGRVGRNSEGRVGRFSWTADHASLLEQNAAALNFDMGIRNPKFPDSQCTTLQQSCLEAESTGLEVTAEGLKDLTRFTQLVGVPSQRTPKDPEILRGLRVFEQIGCSKCHVQTLNTAANAELVNLRSQSFHPFTNLLLHDMGPDLSVRSSDGSKVQSEWRTPPLWGLGLEENVVGRRFLLHDGRARTPEEAILWHGGEAERSKLAFVSLSPEERRRLLAFLESL
jgi:CxxC motif-containing protein (DUF1111 family)